LASHTGTDREAGMIQILDQDLLQPRPGDTRLMVYLARVQDLYDYQVDLGRLGYQLDYHRITDNEWERLRRSRRADFSEDTLIYDSELATVIEPGLLRDTRYIDPQDIEDDDLRERIEDEFYYDRTAYFVVRQTQTDDGSREEVLAMNLAPAAEVETGEEQTEHSLMGTVTGVNVEEGTLILGNRRTWNSLNERWEAAGDATELNMDQAVMVLNDEPLKGEEIYRIREGARAFVLQNRTATDDLSAYVILLEQ